MTGNVMTSLQRVPEVTLPHHQQYQPRPIFAPSMSPHFLLVASNTKPLYPLVGPPKELDE